MMNIQPLDIWSDGDTKTATSILLYKLFDINGTIIYEGQLFFTGQEYIDWGSSGDSNAEAYTLAAAHLNLTLV
jgi:hypothetical protein